MSRKLTLSVVDQSPVRAGGTAADALRDTIQLAVAVEALGYYRYWLAEHHNLPNFAGTSPEVLVGQVAARTNTIRVGSGGVMLSHYSALKVAENFGCWIRFIPAVLTWAWAAPRAATTLPPPLWPIPAALKMCSTTPGRWWTWWATCPAAWSRSIPLPRCRPGRARRKPPRRCGCWVPATKALTWPPGWGCPLPTLTSLAWRGGWPGDCGGLPKAV